MTSQNFLTSLTIILVTLLFLLSVITLFAFCHKFLSILVLPAIACNITKQIKETVLISSFGSSEQPGQMMSSVFKPLSAEGANYERF